MNKLYDSLPYDKEFEATVISTGNDKNGFFALLDKTLFFPAEGGQTPDKGTLNGITVIDVRIENDKIYHYLSEPDSLQSRDTVKGIIDWEHRFSNMQMHTAEHIFSGLVHRILSFDNVGFHLSDNSATMDYSGKLSDSDVRDIEEKVNEIIYQNIPVKASYPSEDELKRLTYRLKKELTGPIRIVDIPGVDTCACCAPHVRNTSEIGLFKVISYESYKGGTRIHYLAGKRAFLDYRKKSDSIKGISEALSAKPGDELEKLNLSITRLKELSFENIGLKNRLIEADISGNLHGTTLGVRFSGPEEIPLMKYTIDTMHKYYEGPCILFAGSDDTEYRFIFESEDSTACKLLDIVKEKFGAKGGGKGNSASGLLVAKRSDLESALKQFGYPDV